MKSCKTFLSLLSEVPEILPNGGYEFGILWSVIVAVFVVTGGGNISVDHLVQQTHYFKRGPIFTKVGLLFR